MNDRIDGLERLLGRVLNGGVLLSTALLAVGLAWWLAGVRVRGSIIVLDAGLIILMLTPMLRVAVSFVEYVRARDWFFAATTLGVLAVIVATVWIASHETGRR